MQPNNSNHKDPIIEYLFKDKSDDECFSSFVTDEQGNRIGYLNLDNGTKVSCYQAANKAPVVEIDINGYQVIYIKNYQNNLACRKVSFESNKMLIYLYNKEFEIIEMYEEDV
jgi:hypothetical protein